MIKRNGIPYSPGTPFTTDDGTQYPGNWYQFASPAQREAVGFVETPDPVIPDSRFYYIDSNNEGVQKDISICQEVVKAELSNVRWNKEVQGIIYSSVNAMFQTDSTSRVNYLGVLNLAVSNSEFQTIWKARDPEEENKPKFVMLTANDIIYIYSYGMDYISKCFIREQALTTEIEAANNLPDLLQINVNSSWPTRVY